MDKRWRNLGLLVLVVLIVAGAFFYFNQPSEKKPVLTSFESSLKDVFSKNGYTFSSLVNEGSAEVDVSKLDKLRQGISSIDLVIGDVNSAALKSYYLGVIDLKKEEKIVLADLDKYTSDENTLCENIDYLGDLDVNMSSLSAKYSGLNALKNSYLQGNTLIIDLNSERYVASADFYTRYYDSVFAVCASFAVNEVVTNE
ncbi:MAG: hypothetical protein WCW44_02515 [archaeon]|jgi:hypothetical protein